MSLDARLQSVWYGPAWRSLPLWPLALLYRAILALRSLGYGIGLLRVEHAGVPVIVVGNLTVGGTGKTPVAAWLARQLEPPSSTRANEILAAKIFCFRISISFTF